LRSGVTAKRDTCSGSMTGSPTRILGAELDLLRVPEMD